LTWDDIVLVREMAGDVGAEQDLVEQLRVALEDVGVPLRRREVLDERVQDPARLEDVDRLRELEELTDQDGR
jgi:hypothetical protein